MHLTKCAVALLLSAAACAAFSQTSDADAARRAMFERAKQAELPGSWTPAPIPQPSHYAAAYAQRLCSAVFIAGMAPAMARDTLGDGNALAPVAQRINMREPVIDRAAHEVRVQTKEGGVTRIARQLGSQGCVILPADGGKLGFVPSKVVPDLPDAKTTSWPMGDLVSTQMPAGVDAEKLKAALAAAFMPDDALTQAFVVTWKGQLIGERYGLGATPGTPLEGWSMGKSIVATLMGVLIQKGVYTLDQRAPIPEWQTAGDPRQAIRFAISCRCRVACASAHSRIPSTCMTARSRTTGISTRRRMRTPTPRAVRRNGRRRRSAAIATPIPCWRATWCASRPRRTPATTTASRSATCSTC